uniref:Uncharacterized protein LOC104215601 n=1 Tax=Nicotiana sylvestris TaxID=4096 RepID=A0A1U7VN06_NICSY|nr:PREDICTED: uncharacterized protein LOC104215601 [Nicotiana sylvestris]
MAPYETLYRSKCRSLIGWYELKEARLLGTDLVRDAMKKTKLIQERLRIVHSRQKSYTNRKAHDVGCDKVQEEGQVESLCCIEIYSLLSSERMALYYWFWDRVGEVAYRLALPFSLLGVHIVFHVSMLHMYYEYHSHMFDFSSVHLDENLAYGEEPVAIFDREVWNLRSKDNASVKVISRGQQVEETTCKTDHDMLKVKWRQTRLGTLSREDVAPARAHLREVDHKCVFCQTAIADVKEEAAPASLHMQIFGSHKLYWT